MKTECRWTRDNDGIYHTACGQAWEYPDGTRLENKQYFCHYCGKIINDSSESAQEKIK